MGVKSPQLARGPEARSCLGVLAPTVDPAESRTRDFQFRFEKELADAVLQVAKTTVGVHQEASRPVAISIPAGTVLRVPDGLANAAGLVDVEWDGETVQVFAVDLRDRGELIKTMSARGGAK